MEKPMEGQTVESSGEETVNAGGVVNEVSGEHIQFGPGIAGTVSAKMDLNIDRSAVIVVRSDQDIHASVVAASALVSGRDLRVTNGGAQTMVVGRDVELTNGGAGMMVVGGSVSVKKGGVGIALCRNLTLEEGSRVLLNTPQALAFGAAFGVFFAIVRGLSKGRRH